MIDPRPLQYTAIFMFALLGALFCVSAYSGAAESKRIAKVNQENVHVARY